VLGSRVLAVAAVLLVVLVAAPVSAAAPARASLPDVEDEVMCLQCGTPLNMSTAPVAERERAFIRREIVAGKTKQQIKDAMVDEFGPRVLAVPEKKGFGLAAWVVPVLVALAALVVAVVMMRRWRGPVRPVAESAAAAPQIKAGDARRLERELRSFDRRGD
jgi:cytochrome c-type biogenesis protein CcmH